MESLCISTKGYEISVKRNDVFLLPYDIMLMTPLQIEKRKEYREPFYRKKKTRGTTT